MRYSHSHFLRDFRPESADIHLPQDSRTGKQITIPILHNSIQATAFKVLKAAPRDGDREEDDHANGIRVYDPAFMNTAAISSKITYIDGDKGFFNLSAKNLVCLPGVRRHGRHRRHSATSRRHPPAGLSLDSAGSPAYVPVYPSLLARSGRTLSDYVLPLPLRHHSSPFFLLTSLILITLFCPVASTYYSP
ncbi:hypothetical protein EV426DRAFT_639894 [Tirmania nivea]|nr:hypothetical protein EV426DRAFT_639894 [Tirmania nivea]